MTRTYHVYILARHKRGTLYVGMTSNLARRMYEHKNGLVDGLTKQYGIKTLVHVEAFDDVHNAIEREKFLKRWNRQWKIDLIEKNNPDWRDLYDLLNA